MHWRDPEIPKSFYILMSGRFVNLVGNSLVFPFMTIYLATRLDAPMALVGLVMTLYGLAQVLAQLVGGVLSDAWGRRPVMIVSLSLGALFTILVGITKSPLELIGALLLMGVSVPLFQPASMAMVGDLVPSHKLSQSYSLMRMASNAGIIVGPMIGGFLADHSFFAIFALDALSMLVYLAIILLSIQEAPRTRQQTHESGHMRDILRDRPFLRFSILWGMTGMVYAQLYQVVPAYLHINLHDPVSTFGYLAAENAVLVVALQWPITRWIGNWKPARLMALGSLFYGIGFAVMLSGTHFLTFVLAVVIITLGENVINPAASTWVAKRAPDTMRGRYMGLFGLANRTGSALGPSLGGSLLTVGSSVWLLSASVGGALVAAGYWRFSHQEEKLPWKRPASVGF